jgi:Zn-dependent peptidase ImmA (M78 family)
VLRRGFKSQCERRSVELRRLLGRQPLEPLLAADVAHHYNVTVWNPLQIAAISASDIQHLLGPGREEWSGFTLRIGTRHLVVMNSAQSPRRQNSVLMHELSHIILGHQLASAMFTEGGDFTPSTYNQDQEDEAAWLGGTLLLPRPALLWMRYQGMSDDEAATYFSVSPDLLRWRIRMTGIDYQLGLGVRRPNNRARA